MAEIGIDEPIAAEYIANCLRTTGSTSMLHVFTHVITIKVDRNRREMLALCRVIDALLCGQREVALERAVRRLAGVHTADSTNSWAAADVIEAVIEKQSFLPSGSCSEH